MSVMPQEVESLEGCQHEQLCPLVMEVVITFGAGSCKAYKVEAFYRRNLQSSGPLVAC